MTEAVDIAPTRQGFWRRLVDTLEYAGTAIEMTQLEIIDIRLRALEKDAREGSDAGAAT